MINPIALDKHPSAHCEITALDIDQELPARKQAMLDRIVRAHLTADGFRHPGPVIPERRVNADVCEHARRLTVLINRHPDPPAFREPEFMAGRIARAETMNN